CRKRVCIAKDLISLLPDEVLFHMLSFLTVEEAANTSVLSRQWLFLAKDLINHKSAWLLGLGDSADSSSCIPHSNDLQILSPVKQNFKSLKVLLFKQ
uniref:F-box domain-containing protein n=1 Tax=Solanum lycopersicum TaxID=4081 RepID=A0A3Q7GZL6_SOLLC